MLRNSGLNRNEVYEPLEDAGKVSGFQSPADDYATDRLDIIKKIITDPVNTFFFMMDSDSMELFAIKKGSILVVDRSIDAAGGMLVVFWYDDKWRIRQLIKHGNTLKLITGAEFDKPIIINQDNNIVIFGVVTWCCTSHLELSHVRISRLQ